MITGPHRKFVKAELYPETIMSNRHHLTGVLGDSSASAIVWGVLDAASVGVSAYHGYKRNNGSIGWAIGWGILGGIFPIFVPAIAFAQGIGKAKK